MQLKRHRNTSQRCEIQRQTVCVCLRHSIGLHYTKTCSKPQWMSMSRVNTIRKTCTNTIRLWRAKKELVWRTLLLHSMTWMNRGEKKKHFPHIVVSGSDDGDGNGGGGRNDGSTSHVENKKENNSTHFLSIVSTRAKEYGKRYTYYIHRIICIVYVYVIPILLFWFKSHEIATHTGKKDIFYYVLNSNHCAQ